MQKDQNVRRIADLLYELLTQDEEVLGESERAAWTRLSARAPSKGNDRREMDADLADSLVRELASPGAQAIVEELGSGVIRRMLASPDLLRGKAGRERDRAIRRARDGVAREDGTRLVHAPLVLLHEFLAPAELARLLDFTLGHRAEFNASEVWSRAQGHAVVDDDYRRSHVIYSPDFYLTFMDGRIRSVLPRVLGRLNHSLFSPSQIEVQLTASNDGEFFKSHRDNDHPGLGGREITFVYYFYREPKAFTGGELRLYDMRQEGNEYTPTRDSQIVVPYQNSIVFFPSFLTHEVMPVRVPSRAFEDSRFTLNGWLHE